MALEKMEEAAAKASDSDVQGFLSSELNKLCLNIMQFPCKMGGGGGARAHLCSSVSQRTLMMVSAV